MEDQSLFNTIDIHIIRATPLIQLTKKLKYTIFAVTIGDIKKALAPKKYTNPTVKALLKYYKHLIAFSQKEADKLPEHRLYNHKIVIKEIKHPRFRPLYRMSQNKL